MFIAIYEFRVRSEASECFRAAWLSVTQTIYRRCGSLGSRLHRAGPQQFVAYAQWPSQSHWESLETGDWTAEEQAASQAMQACLESSKTLHKLEVCDDYLQAAPFVG